jgi:hypothetical protein
MLPITLKKTFPSMSNAEVYDKCHLNSQPRSLCDSVSTVISKYVIFAMWWDGPIEECQLNKNTTSSPTQQYPNNPQMYFLFLYINGHKQLKSQELAPPPSSTYLHLFFPCWTYSLPSSATVEWRQELTKAIQTVVTDLLHTHKKKERSIKSRWRNH